MAELVDLGPVVAMPLPDQDDWVVVRTAIEGNVDYLCSSDGGFFTPSAAAFCAVYGVLVVKPVDLVAILVS